MKNDTKSIFESKTVWGAIIAIVSAVAGLLGYAFGPEEQEMLIMAGTTISTAVGSILSVYGRVKATKKIK